MREIKEVLITAPLSEYNYDRMVRALEPAVLHFCKPGDKEAIAAVIDRCDVAITAADADEQIRAGKNLKWIHCCHAGVEKTITPELFERGVFVTTSSGRSAPALAEHAFMFMMALTYDLVTLLQAKAEHKWAPEGDYKPNYVAHRTGLYRKTLGLIGLGNTGLEAARIAKTFEMTVLGYRRGTEIPANVDQVYSAERGDDLKDMVSRCDYIILCTGLNDGTYHLFDQAMLHTMKPEAFLINMGRGALVDEVALVEALKDGTIAGAGLDTTEIEPLPADSPLYDLPNVLLTPHMTPAHPDKDTKQIDFAIQNIEAYKNEKPFVNQVTERDLWTKR